MLFLRICWDNYSMFLFRCQRKPDANGQSSPLCPFGLFLNHLRKKFSASRINFPELLIAFLVFCHQCRLRLHHSGNPHKAVANRLHTVIGTAGHHGQHSAAHAGTLLGNRGLQSHIQYIGQNPLPISQFDEIYNDNIGILVGGITQL